MRLLLVFLLFTGPAFAQTAVGPDLTQLTHELTQLEQELEACLIRARGRSEQHVCIVPSFTRSNDLLSRHYEEAAAHYRAWPEPSRSEMLTKLTTRYNGWPALRDEHCARVMPRTNEPQLDALARVFCQFKRNLVFTHLLTFKL